MKRLIIVFLFAYLNMCSICIFAQNPKNDESDHFIDPFRESYDWYISNSIRNYELLPIIDDKNHTLPNVTTNNDAIAHAKSKAISSSYSNKLPNASTTGKHTAKLHGPVKINNQDAYFWVVKGYIKHYYDFKRSSEYLSYTAKTPTTEPYILIFYSYKSGNDIYNKTVVFSVSNRSNDIDRTIHDTVNKHVNPIREKRNEELHDIALAKNSWNANGKDIPGKLVKYSKEKISIKAPDKNNPTTHNAKSLSNEDKIILRGYLDHLNLPAK